MINQHQILTVGENEYRVERLDAMSQLHVVRRILPIMTGIGQTISDLRSAASQGEEKDKERFMFAVMTAAMEVVSKMSDTDVEFVLFKCLSRARRKQDERYMPVSNGNQLQFQDMKLEEMVRLSIEVLKVSGVFGFFVEQTGG